MHLEINIALSYLATHLYDKLPRRRITLFQELLAASLATKYGGHWYPTQPQRGSAFRCLRPSEPLLMAAALEANLNYADVVEALPRELCLWVDPGEVSYGVAGEEGGVLWRRGAGGFEGDGWEWGPAHPQPTPQLPHPPLVAPATLTPHHPRPVMTTAAFAQTKFGSTKLKSNATRRAAHCRMSPTEFSNYIKAKQREQEARLEAQQGLPWGWEGGVGAVGSGVGQGGGQGQQQVWGSAAMTAAN